MSVLEWFGNTVLSTSAVCALGWFIFRELISTRLKESVKHEFDTRLETFKQELKLKEIEISSLRNSMLSGVMSRHIALEKRRLEAVDQLWDGWLKIGKFRMAAETVGILKMDKIEEAVKDNPKLQQFAKSLDQFDVTKLEFTGWPARPWVSSMAWAIFMAYSAIISISAVRLKLLQFGAGRDVVNAKGVLKIVEAAMPDRAEFINGNGIDLLHLHLDELERRFMGEIASMIAGEKEDEAQLQRAQGVLSAIAEAQKKSMASSAPEGVPGS